MATKTKIEIINETVEYYSADVLRRAKGKYGECKYKTDNNKYCAVGRCLIDAEKYKDSNECPNNKNILKDLKPEYVGHDASFWCLIQRLHDNDLNWCLTGLTETGINFVKSLKQLYS